MNTSDLCNSLKETASNLRKVGQWVPPKGQVRVVCTSQVPEQAIDRATQFMEKMGTPEAKAKVQEFLNHIDPEILNARKDLCSNRRYDNEAQAKEAIVQFLTTFNPWLEAIKLRMTEADFKIVPSASLV